MFGRKHAIFHATKSYFTFLFFGNPVSIMDGSDHAKVSSVGFYGIRQFAARDMQIAACKIVSFAAQEKKRNGAVCGPAKLVKPFFDFRNFQL